MFLSSVCHFTSPLLLFVYKISLLNVINFKYIGYLTCHWVLQLTFQFNTDILANEEGTNK